MTTDIDNRPDSKVSTTHILKLLSEYPLTEPEHLISLGEAMADVALRTDKSSKGNLEKELEMFRVLSADPDPENPIGNAVTRLIFSRWVSKSQNTFAMVYRRGALTERKREKTVSTKKAVNGRKLIGAASRAKVQKQAENFRHLSKDSAAPAIANVVGLSPGTVRRYLTELFPGLDWKA